MMQTFKVAVGSQHVLLVYTFSLCDRLT